MFKTKLDFLGLFLTVVVFICIFAVCEAKTRNDIIASHKCTCINRTTEIDPCDPYTFLGLEPKVSIFGYLKMFVKGEYEKRY